MKKVHWLNLRSVRGRIGVVGPVRWLVSALSVVLVLITATFVGTNLVTADPVPGASPVTVTFNYNGATGGTSVTSATVTPGVSADSVLPFPTKSGLDFSGWFNTQSLLNGQRITTIGEGDTGELLAGFVPPELAQTLNLVLPPPPTPTCANGLAPCVVGDIGPGDGLVFLISGGKTYEMAPKTWSGSETPDEGFAWCNNTTSVVSGAGGTAIGTGSVNTIAMDAACTSGAGQAATDYAGGGKTDWFLPAQDELGAMYAYKSSIPAGMVASFGFASDSYWSSSQYDGGNAVKQSLGDGSQNLSGKGSTLRVRPVRAF